MARLRDEDDTKVFTNHNVYILGAGFSVDAGIPVLNDFLYETRGSLNWLKRHARNDELTATRQVLLFRKDAASAALRVNLNVENIEDLFSLAEASGGKSISQSVSTAIAATLEYSRQKTTGKTVRATVDQGLSTPPNWENCTGDGTVNQYRIPLYDLYAGLISGNLCRPDEYARNTVITLNYDTILEDSLRNLKADFNYGFGPNSVEYDESWPEMKGSDRLLNVLKLHGSVNWAKPTSGRKKLTVFGQYEDVFKYRRKVFLIPPTWKKDFSGALADVWNAAVRALTEATRIVIIGFSMPPTDIHFKYLVAAGLQNNISLRNVLL